MIEIAKHGGWYYFVICHKCKENIILAKAPSPTEEKAPMVRGREASCHDCGTVDSYHANEVRRGQVNENL